MMAIHNHRANGSQWSSIYILKNSTTISDSWQSSGLNETHVPLYQREIQDLLYASSGITNTKRQSSSRNGKQNSHPKAQIISLRPKSAKQSERELEYKYKKKVKYTKKWFDQFAVHIPNNNRNNLQRPKTATPKYKPRTKIFNVPPPPYESAFSGRPMPFRPEFVGNERVNMEDPHYKAKKRQKIAESVI